MTFLCFGGNETATLSATEKSCEILPALTRGVSLSMQTTSLFVPHHRVLGFQYIVR